METSIIPQITVIKHKLIYIYYLIYTYVISMWYSLLQLIKPHKEARLTNQTERVALITGGGTGIGYETAKKFLNIGMTVVILGIEADQREGVRSLQHIHEDHVKFLECDLSSLKSVRKAAKLYTSLNLPLHILVNNAGIMFAPRKETEEGFECHWVINYLSHFLLSRLLLKTLIDSSSSSNPARIVNLSSILHYPGSINFNDTQGKKFYSAEAAYNQSKLAMVLFSSAMAKRLSDSNIPVLINSVHPAVTFSGLYKHTWLDRIIPGVMRFILSTPEMGSETVVHVAISDQVTKGGDYYENCQVETPSKEARSKQVSEKLWKLSCDQAGMSYELRN